LKCLTQIPLQKGGRIGNLGPGTREDHVPAGLEKPPQTGNGRGGREAGKGKRLTF